MVSGTTRVSITFSGISCASRLGKVAVALTVSEMR
jgi:hypothetical protein